MLSVCLVEDDPLAAELLRAYVEDPSDAEEPLELVMHYPSGELALEGINEPLPDVVLMDVSLGGLSGIDATRQLKLLYPGLEVLMLTTFDDTNTVFCAIKAGASGYLLKASAAEDIRRAVREVHAGGSFLSSAVARKVLGEFQSRLSEPGPAADPRVETLTPREHEILDRLIDGQSYKVMAIELDISVHTVNNHIRHVYEKLHVNSRAEAVAAALGVSPRLR